MSEARPNADRPLTALAVMALAALAVGLALVLGALGRPDMALELRDQWAWVHAEGRREALSLPFRPPPDHPEPLVVLEHTLAIPQGMEEPALLLRGIDGGVAVWLNDVLLGHAGAVPGLAPRVQRGQLVVGIPPDLARLGQGALKVQLFRGDGHPAMLGRPLLGSRAELERLAAARIGERLALVASLLIAAVLGLVIAAVRPSQREFFWFGLVCIEAMIAAFAHPDTGWLVDLDDGLIRPLADAALVLLPGSGLMFIAQVTRAQVVHPKVHRLASAPLALGVLAAVPALVLPSPPLLRAVEFLSLLLSATSLAAMVALLRASLRHGDHIAASLLLAVGTLAVAATAERLAIGLSGEPIGLLLPGFLVFLGTSAGTLVLGRTDLADRYQELVTHARDGILVVLRDGVVEEANEAARLLFAREPMGAPLRDLLPRPEDAQRLLAARRQGAGAAKGEELELRGAHGRTATVEIVTTELPEGRTLLILRDLTGRRAYEQGMLHAARMETVGILAGGIAHDFNNVLTSLMAHLEMLRQRLREPAEQERLNRMETVIRRAGLMTRRLLTMARGGSKERLAIRPEEPIHEAVELARSMLPRGVLLREQFDTDLPMVLASPEDLEQAILNLVVNARDALAPTGGSIRVRVRTHREEGLRAGVRIEVEDDGPGVPDSIRAAIWEPFFTTKGEGRGTGLGLSVVARVVRDHGGRVELLPGRGREPGRPGTIFAIILPEHIGTSPSTSLPPAQDESVILLVEDEDEIRDHVRSELLARGFRVLAAASVAEAQRIAEAAVGPIHLLVTDVVLGESDGITLAWNLLARRPTLKVVIMSGFIPQHNDALDPSWQRLHKPFTSEQLAIAVRRALIGVTDAAPPAAETRS